MMNLRAIHPSLQRISTSDNYYHGYDCDLRDCERHYCHKHRELWRDCDTAKNDRDDTGRRFWTLGDCPRCERDSRAKEAQRYADQWEAQNAKTA